jgi:hypothetical protein|mmetsp:Transcript_30188/g.51045  ORF Transcript_30188/g.51045 Transcript_30188/m.51045 type:complete len:91 (+) Transcript_30188:1-273(+)
MYELLSVGIIGTPTAGHLSQQHIRIATTNRLSACPSYTLIHGYTQPHLNSPVAEQQDIRKCEHECWCLSMVHTVFIEVPGKGYIDRRVRG